MAQSRVFSLVGDSNIQRHINPTNCQGRALMESAEVLPCTRMEAFRTSISTVRVESNVCVVSCITNFLTSSPSCDTISLRLDPVLKDFFAVISGECSKYPDRKYLVSPPMYRRAPLWYRDSIAEVMNRFSLSYEKITAKNLILLPSFPSPVFESDGVHLNAYSGLQFVMHLFESSVKLLDTLASEPEIRESRALESNRLIGDRVVALEQGLIRLSSSFDMKAAIDAELHDFRANERLEDSFVVTGLRPIPSGLTGKSWQDKAKSDISALIKKLLDRESPIIVVHNVTGRAPGSEVTYNVKLESVQDSRSLRAKFGSFFAGGQDRRPSAFKDISISNCVTRETRVRIAILKLYGQRYKASNPGSKFQVIGYQPRPLLKLTPPPDSGDRRVRTFNFIEAVTSLKSDFSTDEVSPLLKKYGSKYRGKLRSLFVVLSDDEVPSSDSLARSQRSKRAPSPSGSGSESSRPRLN